MPRPTLDFLVISHGRPDEARRAIESAAGQGFERRLLLDNGTEPPLQGGPDHELFRSGENLGAAGGRNRLVQESTADAFVFIDDDVTLQPGAGEAVARAFERDPDLAGIAFRVEREDGEMLQREQPYRMGLPTPERAEPCGYFVGIGFAMRRAVFTALGGFDDRMVYGSEEIDFAFKLAARGYRLIYEPAAVVIHRPSTAGRLPSGERASVHLANRVQLARTHLPRPLATAHSLAWAALMGRDAIAAKDPGAVLRGLREGVRRPIDRRPLPLATLRDLHRIGGRVLF
jgi:GT2 family glycosyltransferase